VLAACQAVQLVFTAVGISRFVERDWSGMDDYLRRERIVVVSLLFVHILFVGLVLVVILQLISLHIYLKCKGITTFEWIKLRREAAEQLRSQKVRHQVEITTVNQPEEGQVKAVDGQCQAVLPLQDLIAANQS
jgi:hypothetical protein